MPHYCYDNNLSIAGNCRIYIVEMGNLPVKYVKSIDLEGRILVREVGPKIEYILIPTKRHTQTYFIKYLFEKLIQLRNLF